MGVYIDNHELKFEFYLFEFDNFSSKFNTNKYTHCIKLYEFVNHYGAVDRVTMKDIAWRLDEVWELDFIDKALYYEDSNNCFLYIRSVLL